MADFRGSMIAQCPDGALDDAAIGLLLDLLKHHDGALTVEPERFTLTFSFDSASTAGFAPGLVQAIPRALSIGRTLLTQCGLAEAVGVVGLSVERVPWS